MVDAATTKVSSKIVFFFRILVSILFYIYFKYLLVVAEQREGDEKSLLTSTITTIETYFVFSMFLLSVAAITKLLAQYFVPSRRIDILRLVIELDQHSYSFF